MLLRYLLEWRKLLPSRATLVNSGRVAFLLLCCLVLPLLCFAVLESWKGRCAICEGLVGDYRSRVEDREGAAEHLVKALCTKFHVEKPDVCAGVTSEYGPLVVHVLANRLLDPYHICTEVLGVCTPGGRGRRGGKDHPLVPIPCNHTAIFADMHGLPPFTRKHITQEGEGLVRELWGGWKRSWVLFRWRFVQLWQGVFRPPPHHHPPQPPRADVPFRSVLEAVPGCRGGKLSAAGGGCEGVRSDRTYEVPQVANVGAHTSAVGVDSWQGGGQLALGEGGEIGVQRGGEGGVGYFLQLSDVHLDLGYRVGAEAHCGRPLCCREEDGPAVSPESAAQKFGNYQCDAPLPLLDSLLAFVAAPGNLPPLDFVVFTGDIPPHDTWEVTQEATIDAFAAFDRALVKALPPTPFYPILGNHAAVPVDSFPGPPVNAWLMNATWASWRRWLPPEAEETVRKGGYYTALQRPGLRIVGLNTQYCDLLNFWLLEHTSEIDPANQLEWLLQVLESARNAEERVVILGHIPFGDSACYASYAGRYGLVVDRYADVIVGQLFGHTHSDHFHLHYDAATSAEPVGVSLIAPSVTPYTNRNPSFRLFEYTPPSKSTPFQLLDYQQYMLDLGLANERDSASQWVVEYSAKEAYHLQSMSPQSWATLAHNLSEDRALFQAWAGRRSVQRPWVCDEVCRKAMLCYMKSATFDRFLQCAGPRYDSWDEFLKAILNQLFLC